MPFACAQARMSRLRRRLAAVRTARRGIFPALRACSMNGAICARSRAAFFELRSISYSAPLIPNRRVSSAGPPSRSSCSVMLVLLAIPTPRDGDRQIRAVQARCYVRKGDAQAGKGDARAGHLAAEPIAVTVVLPGPERVRQLPT